LSRLKGGEGGGKHGEVDEESPTHLILSKGWDALSFLGKGGKARPVSGYRGWGEKEGMRALPLITRFT